MHWRMILKLRFPLGVGVQSPMSGSPDQGSDTRKISPQSIRIWSSAQLNCRSLPGQSENRDFSLNGAHKTPGQKQSCDRSLAGPDLPVGLSEPPGEAGGCHSPWEHSISGKQRWPYWLVSINTTPGPAPQHHRWWDASSHTTKGAEHRPSHQQTRPWTCDGCTWRPSPSSFYQGTGARSKKTRTGHTGQTLPWGLLGPGPAH